MTTSESEVFQPSTSTYSNQIHILDVKISTKVELSNDGFLIERKTALPKGLQLTDVLKSPEKYPDVIVYYLIKDQHSGLEYLELVSAMLLIPIEVFLFKAWRQKRIYPFFGPCAELAISDRLIDSFPSIKMLFQNKIKRIFINNIQTVTGSIKSFEKDILFYIVSREMQLKVKFANYCKAQIIVNSTRAYYRYPTGYRKHEHNYLIGVPPDLTPIDFPNNYDQFKNLYSLEPSFQLNNIDDFLFDISETDQYPEKDVPQFIPTEVMEAQLQREMIIRECFDRLDGVRQIYNRNDLSKPIYAAIANHQFGAHVYDFHIECEHGTKVKIDQLKNASLEMHSDPRRWCSKCGQNNMSYELTQNYIIEHVGFRHLFNLDVFNIFTSDKKSK